MVPTKGADDAETLETKGSLSLQPVIKEIVRTQFCPPVRLLVDKVHVLCYGDESEGGGAYRLWLSDGDKSIQALPRQELHPFLASKEIQGGSIVLVTKYRLSKAKKLSGNGDVWLLLLDNMQPVGSDGRMAREYTVERLANPSQGSTVKSPGASEHSESTGDARDTPRDSAFEELLSGLSDQHQETPTKDLQNESEAEPPSPSELASRSKKQIATPMKAQQSELEAGAVLSLEARSAGNSKVLESSNQPADSRASNVKPITRPLKLTALSSIIGPKASRNRVIDVVGVVCEVNPDIVRRANMPDQRDIRVMDTSTTKRVQLTVFVDAINFLPKMGTVALFRSVTTHEWNGGSLKAYPRDCEGRDWFLPGKVDESAAEELRAWWLQNLTKEEVEGQE